MKPLLNLSLAMIALTSVSAIDFSSLTSCATLAGTNEECTSSYESCGYFLVKRGETAKDRDQYDYGCILTKWCNKKGIYKGQETIFTCPYGEKDVKVAEARKALDNAKTREALAKHESYEIHKFGTECESMDPEYEARLIPGGYNPNDCRLLTYPAPK